MDLEAELLREHSKRHAEKIARWVGSDQRRLKMLMELFLNGDILVAQRAAWVVSLAAEGDLLPFRRYLKQMLARVQQPGVHDAVKRAVIRSLQSMDIPSELLGSVANVCFDQLSSAQAPIAVKCFAMTVLARIAVKEPELERELRLVIEQQLPFASAGFKARARKTLARLE